MSRLPLGPTSLAAWLVLACTPSARADSIGPCPDGQVVVVNPSSPGSMHHGGFHCEPDPNASRCSALPGAGDGGRGALVVLAGLAVLARRRR